MTRQKFEELFESLSVGGGSVMVVLADGRPARRKKADPEE
jgi:hypothetical protein